MSTTTPVLLIKVLKSALDYIKYVVMERCQDLPTVAVAHTFLTVMQFQKKRFSLKYNKKKPLKKLRKHKPRWIDRVTWLKEAIPQLVG